MDYLGTQGYWLCAVVAVLSLALLALLGHVIIGAAFLLFFYLGGVGVREHSRYAALAVLSMYALDMLGSGPSVVRVLMTALLLSNLRATWIASRWKPASEEAIQPPRLSETWSDKFADQLPTWLWPKVRVLFYVLSICLFLLVTVGLTVVSHFRR